MKTINVFLICLAITSCILGIGYLIFANQLSETPYEKCIDICYKLPYSMSLDCIKNCNSEFKDVIIQVSKELSPILEEYLGATNEN